MTPDEVIDLLTLAAAYDRRTVGQADVEAWLDAATRMHWTATAAQEALKAHYASSTQFAMPGHVTDRIRQDRRYPAPAAGLLGPAAPASDDHRVTVMGQIREFAGRFGLPREVRQARARDVAARERARRELDAIRDDKPAPRQEPA
jgi:hypothetical protein